MNYTIDEIKSVVKRMVADMPGVQERATNGQDMDLQLMLDDLGGWNVVSVLRTAAACALVKKLPADDSDVLFIVRVLKVYSFTSAQRQPASIR